MKETALIITVILALMSMMPGGGVGDSYQPIEKKYQLTRKALQLLYGYNLPVHVLTKSTLIQSRN